MVPEKYRAEFEAHRDGLRQEIKPDGALAEDLFRQLVHAGWNMQRIERRQILLFVDPSSATHPSFENEARLLTRCHANFHRIYQRTLRALREHQTNTEVARISVPSETRKKISRLCRPAAIRRAVAEAKRSAQPPLSPTKAKRAARRDEIDTRSSAVAA